MAVWGFYGLNDDANHLLLAGLIYGRDMNCYGLICVSACVFG